MEVGNLVCCTIDDTIGVILNIEHRLDGLGRLDSIRYWTYWTDCEYSWLGEEDIEVIAE